MPDGIVDIGAVLPEQVVKTGYPATASSSFWGPASAIGGGIISTGMQMYEGKRQRDWMERMSNTAHQREVADLRAAGLNPILSGTGGSGASVGTPSLPNVSAAGEGVAAAGRMSALELRALESNLALNEAATREKNASAAFSGVAASKVALESEAVKTGNKYIDSLKQQELQLMLSTMNLNYASALRQSYESSGAALGPLGTFRTPVLEWGNGDKLLRFDGTHGYGGNNSARRGATGKW